MWGWRDYPVYEASRNKQHPHNTGFATEFPFIEHVRELRRRIICSLAAIVLLFEVGLLCARAAHRRKIQEQDNDD